MPRPMYIVAIFYKHHLYYELFCTYNLIGSPLQMVCIYTYAPNTVWLSVAPYHSESHCVYT